MKTASEKEIQTELKRFQNKVVKAAEALKGVNYETFNDKFQDTEVETAIADIGALRTVIYRIADSII